MTKALARLPKAPADKIAAPIARFLHLEAMGGLVLLCCTLLALGLSNSPLSERFLGFWSMYVGIHIGGVDFSRSLQHWINDGLMTLFFFVIALELKRELVLGELRSPKMAALPLAAAIGGMAVPALVFLLIAGDGAGAHGWGTVMATDTAFVIGCLAILGRRVPQSLRIFLLSLAIFDDVGAIMVVALGYGGPLDAIMLLWAGIGLGLAALCNRLGVRSMSVYWLIGIGVWLAIDASGIHATLAGVILGLMAPSQNWVSDQRLQAILTQLLERIPGDLKKKDAAIRQDLRQARIAAREALSPIERLETTLHPWVAFLIMPVFALANAGVPIGSVHFQPDLTLAILAGFILGKPIGVFLFSVVAVRLGLAQRPDSLTWPVIAGGGMLTGIGFTMALFIAELAFGSDLLGSVKLGILGASAVSGLAGFLTLAWFSRRTTPQDTA